MRPAGFASYAKLRFFPLHHPAAHLFENKRKIVYKTGPALEGKLPPSSGHFLNTAS